MISIPARPYSVSVNISTAFTAQIDVFELLAGTGKPLVLLGFEFGQTSEIGDAQEEMLSLVLKRVTGAPTSGSGGGTSTPAPTSPNDTAAGATVETGNTTKLSGGTSTDVARFSWNVRTPLIYLPLPEDRIVLDAATRLVLELVTTPADSISALVGRISIAELV